ncbi:APC family permease [Telmatospirillum sp.]|uniref:APC family permease n=1 Tax=Telmatospirillum sp. TaxID=2079197 RepID=UPI00283C31D4|nr:APC family permease [Telmatospirillum sp.]MDR3439984.1 APC family permease [Telmatospirillum sp.]
MSDNQLRNLKKVMGFPEVIALAFGQIIGAGVFVITGIGIGLTGKGVILAFIISGVINCAYATVIAQMSAAIPATGAGYRYSTLLLGPRFGFLWELGVICSKVNLALYSLSFAQYLAGLFPSIPIRSAALAMLTFFYLLNLVGLKPAAELQKWLVVVKLSALFVFVAWGISSVDIKGFASIDALVPNGWDNMFQAIAILSFASAGGNIVAELGGEMKNPRRDIPLAVYIGTIGSTLIYVLVAAVAAGVLPISEVADKPLSAVAKAVLPQTAYVYFMIGGAAIALCTTLNSMFQYVTKGMLVACQDGWLPKGFGVVNKRFGTPHYCLTFFYLIGVVTILAGLSLGNVARIGYSFKLFIDIIPVVGCYFLVKKYPVQYRNAPFRLEPGTLNIVVSLAILILGSQAFYTLKGLPTDLLTGTLIAMALAVAYVCIAGHWIDRSRITQIEADEPAASPVVLSDGAVGKIG